MEFHAKEQLPGLLDWMRQQMKACGGKCVIQSMFLKGAWQGVDVDNTTDKYVLPWVDAVAAIKPAGVDV